MTKRILIPTDFSIESLNFLKKVVEEAEQGVKLDIILLYGIQTGDSIRDLLYFSKSRLLKQYVSKDFDDACNMIMNKYSSQINAIIKEVYTGFTQSAFDNLMKGLSVNEIYLSDSFVPNYNKKEGINLLPYIKKSNVRKVELPHTVSTYVVAKNNLSQVFSSSVMQ